MSTKELINLYDSLIEIWSNKLNLYSILDESVKTLIVQFAVITNALMIYKWSFIHYIHETDGYFKSNYTNSFYLDITENYTFSFTTYGSKHWSLNGKYEMIHETKIRLLFDDKSALQIIKKCKIKKETLRNVYLQRIEKLRIKDKKSKEKVVQIINKMIMDPFECYKGICKRIKVKPLSRYYGKEWNVVLNKNRNKCQIKRGKKVIHMFDRNNTEEIDSDYEEPRKGTYYPDGLSSDDFSW